MRSTRPPRPGPRPALRAAGAGLGLPAAVVWHAASARGRCETALEIEGGRSWSGDLVCGADLVVGDGCLVQGSLKAHGRLQLGAGCRVEGSLVASGPVTLGAGCSVRGSVVSESSVLLGAGCVVGLPALPCTVAAPYIEMAAEVVAHGTVWASVEGFCSAADRLPQAATAAPAAGPWPLMAAVADADAVAEQGRHGMSAARFRALWWRRAAALLALAVPAALLALPWPFATPAADGLSPTRLTLLLPDGAPVDSVPVQAWQAAAEETGFLLDVQSASQLMRAGGPARATVLIVPDGLHQRMNDALVAHLEKLVQAGAQLMLVHDAGTATLDGRFHPTASRLSALAGVRYALYGDWGAAMQTEQVAWVDAAAVPLLQVPPGKLMREGSDSPLTSAQAAPLADEDLALVGYHYGRLRYPGFKTAGTFSGQRLMHGADNNLIAGVHRVGAGQVLFVNLPLTYLKLRTDGLLLHAFLRHFAQDIAGLPQLAPMARGQGALVMNWHIDSASAVPAMEKLKVLGAFEQGPYSVHITAGPDVDVPGDGLGMDLARNPTMQAWVRFFVSRGDEVGSHGGWIHNEFGRLIGSQARSQSAALIDRNTQVVSQASGKAVREYSAPTGSHPAWVTPWLRDHGVQAYYFTGDIGMPPTRSFQDGQRGPRDVWAFPVLSHGRHAAFEEAGAQRVPEAEMAAWLKDVADFCASARTVRLVYFHPPGVTLFPQAFADWLRHTRSLLDSGRLRWTTMAQQTDFANRRLLTQWRVEPRSEAGGAPGALRLLAEHPTSLAELTWLLPADRYAEPQVLQGRAQVLRDGASWRVTAGPGLQLAIGLNRRGSAAPDTSKVPL